MRVKKASACSELEIHQVSKNQYFSVERWAQENMICSKLAAQETPKLPINP